MATSAIQYFFLLSTAYFTLKIFNGLDAQNIPAGYEHYAHLQYNQDQQMPEGRETTEDFREAMKLGTTKRKYTRTTPVVVDTLDDPCDYQAYYCMRAYDTGRLCARSVHYRYENFTNYCMMDYVNCRERYNVWIVVHMGDCMAYKQEFVDYINYEYQDDLFMDQIYVIQE